MIAVAMIDWQPMRAMPDDRNDGRQVLLWSEYQRAVVAAWSLGHWYTSGYGEDAGGEIELPRFQADINPPE